LFCLFCALQSAYSAPKYSHYAKITCHADCGQCERWFDYNGDPCAQTWYCTTITGATRAMGCTSYTWLAFGGGASDEDAMEAGAILKTMIL